jgi:hypothetical protein
VERIHVERSAAGDRVGNRLDLFDRGDRSFLSIEAVEHLSVLLHGGFCFVSADLVWLIRS